MAIMTNSDEPYDIWNSTYWQQILARLKRGEKIQDWEYIHNENIPEDHEPNPVWIDMDIWVYKGFVVYEEGYTTNYNTHSEDHTTNIIRVDNEFVIPPDNDPIYEFTSVRFELLHQSPLLIHDMSKDW